MPDRYSDIDSRSSNKISHKDFMNTGGQIVMLRTLTFFHRRSRISNMIEKNPTCNVNAIVFLFQEP